MTDRLEKGNNSFNYYDSSSAIDVTVVDILDREIEAGDFVVLCFRFEADDIFYIWNDMIEETEDFCVYPSTFYLVTYEGILEYNKKNNCFIKISLAVFRLEFNCRLEVYKLDIRLPSMRLLVSQSYNNYSIIESDRFNLENVISRHKEATDVKAGDLVYRLSPNFNKMSAYSRYAIRTGTYQHYVYNNFMHELSINRKDNCMYYYKVLEPTEQEKEIHQILKKQYFEYMQDKIKFLTKKGFTPGDMAILDNYIYIYLFTISETGYQRNKNIFLQLEAYDNNYNSRLATQMLLGEISENEYLELLDKYNVTLRYLHAKWFKESYVGSIKKGITEKVITKAKMRYITYDKTHRVKTTRISYL